MQQFSTAVLTLAQDTRRFPETTRVNLKAETGKHHDAQ
jgi:hypothetical protein